MEITKEQLVVLSSLMKNIVYKKGLDLIIKHQVMADNDALLDVLEDRTRLQAEVESLSKQLGIDSNEIEKTIFKG
jgi:hypothetical protein